MKKTLCFILALSMCISAFSCSDKKKDSKPEPDITEEEIALEKPFFTMEKEEFSKISVTPTRSEDTPPITLESLDVSSLDFGARVPICTKDHDYEKYHTYSCFFELKYYTSLDDINPDYPYYESEFKTKDGEPTYCQNVPDKQAEELIYSAQKGDVKAFSIEGDTAYIAVSFEPDSTEESHEWSVFTYDIPTGKLDEIYTYCSEENPVSLGYSYFAGGKFWYYETYYTYSEMLSSMLQNDSAESETTEEETAEPKSAYTLYAIDLETKETTEVYSSENYFVYSTDDGITIHEYVRDGDSEYNVIKSIDTDTYEVSEVCSYPQEAAASMYYASCGIGAYLEKHEGSRTLDIVTTDYRIDTGLRNGEPVYADGNCFIVMVSDNFSTVLHYYDIEQKIHYTIDTANYGNQAYYCSGGVIITDFKDGAPVYYVMPDLGLFFELVGFSGSTEGLKPVTDDDGETYYEYANEGIRIDDFNTNSGSVSFSGHSTVSINPKEHNVYSFDVINTIYHISGKSEK